MQIEHLNLNEVANTDVSYMEKYYPDKYRLHQINTPSIHNTGLELGEHYKLINYISNQYKNKTLLDIGSRDGISALAMAKCNNIIISYDIKPVLCDWNNTYPNVTFKQLNILKEKDEILLNASFMLLDIDPHDGLQELEFFTRLRQIKYKGIIILDDIKLNQPMINLWDNIYEEKYDITTWGHGSGTGIVIFK